MIGRCLGVLSSHRRFWPRKRPGMYPPIFSKIFLKVHIVILYIHTKPFVEFCIGLGAMSFLISFFEWFRSIFQKFPKFPKFLENTKILVEWVFHEDVWAQKISRKSVRLTSGAGWLGMEWPIVNIQLNSFLGFCPISSQSNFWCIPKLHPWQ